MTVVLVLGAAAGVTYLFTRDEIAGPEPVVASPTAAGTASATPPPTRIPTPAPTALLSPGAAATPTFPPPSSDAGRGVGEIRSVTFDACSSEAACGHVAADETWVVLGRFRPSPAIEAVNVETGARVSVPIARAPGSLHVRDGVVVYFTATGPEGGVDETWIVWRLDLGRAGSAPVKLDEFDAVIFGGGDTLNPWPDPKTNGRDVVWLRVIEDGRAYEVVVSRGDALPTVLETTAEHTFYAIDGLGRIATTTAAGEGEVSLRVYPAQSGTHLELGRRDARNGGLVDWAGERVVWFEGYGVVRPPVRADLFDPATGNGAPFDPPAGCTLFFGTTIRHLLVSCLDGVVNAHDLKTGGILRLAPVVRAFPRALLMRSTAEFNAGEGAWLHAPVLP
ncbi:MAG: hypothetical protein ACRDGT_06700 [Candidatus Limnocylindria bacterium]